MKPTNIKSKTTTPTTTPRTTPRTTTTAKSDAYLTMESLALPRELYWDGKVEPTSPCSNNDWILQTFDDNFANGITTDESMELVLGDGHFITEEFVIELCNLKEENWNNIAKSPASPQQQQQQQQQQHYLDFSIDAGITQPNPLTKVPDPFDAHADFYADTILTQLTPPQSPPQNVASPAFTKTENTTIDEVALPMPTPPTLPAIAVVPATAGQYAGWPGSHDATTLTPDLNHDEKIAREIQIFDEIVKTRVQELPEWIDECDTQSSDSAPSQADSSIGDDEWRADSSYSSSSAASSPTHFFSSSDDQASSAKGATGKKRTRPYGRGVEDRKIRKKEQNKNAATRYRQKKKIEMETVLNEEQQLTQRNEELKNTLAERSREATYLKGLIREFYKNKKK